MRHLELKLVLQQSTFLATLEETVNSSLHVSDMLHGEVSDLNLQWSKKTAVIVAKSFTLCNQCRPKTLKGQLLRWDVTCCIPPATCLATLLRHKLQGKSLF